MDSKIETAKVSSTEQPERASVRHVTERNAVERVAERRPHDDRGHEIVLAERASPTHR